MRLYLSAAVTAGRKNYPKVRKIKNILEKLGHEVVGGALNSKIVPGENLDPRALFQRESQLVDKCDGVVAEVTVPSWGSAFLMEHALRHQKPVLALFYKTKYKNGWPAMIKGHPNLYTLAYDEKTLKNTIINHMDFLRDRKIRKGFFVAIEGVDGSGKTTQVRMLMDAIRKKGHEVRLIDFPRYYTSFHGEVITRLLRGEFGSMDQLSPQLASLAYALDRMTARDEINTWLGSDLVVVANRYTGSNMAHQAAKITPRQQLKFIRWVDEMEYQLHQIPREDMTVFLDVPVKVSQRLILKKEKRAYLKWRDKKDIAEKDLSHQKKSYAMYRKLVDYYPNWHRVNCVNSKKQILSPEKIHQKLVRKVIKEMKKY